MINPRNTGPSSVLGSNSNIEKDSKCQMQFWEEKWRNIFVKYPHGQFPVGTYENYLLGKIKNGSASNACYEGMVQSLKSVDKRIADLFLKEIV